MARACAGNETRRLARSLGMAPVVPAKRNRREPWAHDRELCKRRNETEQLFRRLKGSGVFTRFDKLDTLYLGFLCLALIVEELRGCQQALIRNHLKRLRISPSPHEDSPVWRGLPRASCPEPQIEHGLSLRKLLLCMAAETICSPVRACHALQLKKWAPHAGTISV